MTPRTGRYWEMKIEEMLVANDDFRKWLEHKVEAHRGEIEKNFDILRKIPNGDQTIKDAIARDQTAMDSYQRGLDLLTKYENEMGFEPN